jgi:hypothetical protein
MEKLYTVKQAAKYLNLPESVIDRAYYRSRKLKGINLAADGERARIFFTQQQLDDFAALPRKPGYPLGRPKRKSKSPP